MTAPGFRLHARFFAFLLLAAATGGIFTSPAKAWWNNQWTVRKKITLDLSTAGGSIADPVGTTVVLVRLHDANFQFSSAKSDGSDLRFVADDDKTLVPYHIEKFDSLLNEAFVWVQVPDIKPGEVRSLWLYYGNSAAPAAEDVRRTYDAQTVLVYHFNEHGQPARDSSPAGNDAANAGAPADGSIIGTGLRLDGHSSLNLPGTPSLSWTDGGAMTWSIWVKAAALASRTVIFSRHQEERSFTIGLDRGIPFVEVKDSDGTHRSPAGNPVPPGQWHHLAVVATGTAITIYLDGQSYAQFPGRLPALATAAVLGVDTTASPMEQAGAGGFSGEVDELEISRISRPPGFVEFAAMNQGGAQAKLLTLGADEERATWLSWLKSGYFGIILDSLTLDGWVVIGLLFIMGLISWSVMVGKAVYLASIGRGNSLFMREWHHLAADLTTLDDGADEKVETMGGRVDSSGQRALHASPIYRIFHIGAGEIRHRLGGNQGDGPKALSARSLQAIRATLDGALVRETQRLNSQMVLLTIAISGGPFLGLLGTVVGVMITFAAIAAAGDVNVNAIAPGIAAALVATVAGLAVAIPSLFGYNYLLSRVKDATSDMHVFIDEFVAKMAEFYPEPPR